MNVIGQIFFIDKFLDGEFSTYGMRVFEYSGLEAEDRPDPMAVVFPKVYSYQVKGCLCENISIKMIC